MKQLPRVKVKPGDTFKTNNYGDVVVISSESCKDITVRFILTGYVTTAAASSLRNGHVTDHQEKARLTKERRDKASMDRIAKNQHIKKEQERAREAKELDKARIEDQKAATPSVFGIGYLGIGRHKAYIDQYTPHQTYQIWRAMLRRCYYILPSGERAHKSYSGVTVCPEWHNYQSFAEWYTSNYPAGAEPGEYQLDKDINGDSARVYSPSSCMFVTQQENLKHRRRYRRYCNTL